jgi:hypothetical protein
MQRRTFDLLVTLGGLLLAVALLVAGLIFRANADFAKDNVRQQLAAQKISFPPADALSKEEREQAGIVKYAGQRVTTGDQARVYADEFIALHLEQSLGGKTYSELSTESRADPANEELAGKVQTAFRGETLRGLLLTTFAFWTLGEKAEQASMAFLLGAGLLILLSLLGLWHYSRTPRSQILRAN